MDNQGIEYIESMAASIMKEYPRDSLKKDLNIKNIKIMEKHMVLLASNEVYQGINENETPSQDYLSKNFELCKKLIALAGYRLADLLKNQSEFYNDEISHEENTNIKMDL